MLEIICSGSICKPWLHNMYTKYSQMDVYITCHNVLHLYLHLTTALLIINPHTTRNEYFKTRSPLYILNKKIKPPCLYLDLFTVSPVLMVISY